MSQPKAHTPSRKDQEGHNLFTWKQFNSPFSGSESSAMGRDCRHSNSYEILAVETSPEPIQMVSESALLKEANANLMKKVVQREQECQELHAHVRLLSKTNSELVEEVRQLGLNNQGLHLQTLALQEENDFLLSELSTFRKSYSSNGSSGPTLSCFPAWTSSRRSADGSESKESPEVRETWEALSNRMLQQMHLEMMTEGHESTTILPESDQLVPLSNSQKEQPSELENDGVLVHTASDFKPSPLNAETELESAHSLVYHLKSQVEQLQTQLSTQGTVLRNALAQVHKFCAADPSLHVKSRVLNQSSQSESGSKFNRPSDELFRAYFTQQLYSSAGTVGIRNQDSEGKTVTVTSSDDGVSKSTNSSNLQEKTHEKVCPMCEVVLPPDTPQGEFEDHVFQCLDHENTLLLEQYEMV